MYLDKLIRKFTTTRIVIIKTIRIYVYTKSTFVIMAVIIIFKDFRIRKVLLNLVVTTKPEFLS